MDIDTIDQLRSDLLAKLNVSKQSEEELRLKEEAEKSSVVEGYVASIKKNTEECVSAIQKGVDAYVESLNRSVVAYLDEIDKHYRSKLKEAAKQIEDVLINEGDVAARNSRHRELQSAIKSIQDIEVALSEERSQVAEKIINAVSADTKLSSALHGYGNYSWLTKIDDVVKNAALEEFREINRDLSNRLERLQEQFIEFVGIQDVRACQDEEERRSIDNINLQLQKASDQQEIAQVLQEKMKELEGFLNNASKTQKFQGNKILAALREKFIPVHNQIDKIAEELREGSKNNLSDFRIVANNVGLQLGAIEGELKALTSMPATDFGSLFNKEVYELLGKRKGWYIIWLSILFIILSAGSGWIGNSLYTYGCSHWSWTSRWYLCSPPSMVVSQATLTNTHRSNEGSLVTQIGSPIVFRYLKGETKILSQANAIPVQQLKKSLSELPEGNYRLEAVAYTSREPLRNKTDFNSNEELAIARANSAKFFFEDVVNDLKLSDRKVRVNVTTLWDVGARLGDNSDNRICRATLKKMD